MRQVTTKISRMLIILFVPLLMAACSCESAWAQNILLDHYRKCGPLICYPSADDSSVFYYLPSKPHLSLEDDGIPEFSFLRYVEAEATNGEGGITEAEGGGIVHFLVDYSASERELGEAQKQLKDENEEALLKGPVIFEEGHFALVSSFVPDEKAPQGGDVLSRRVIGMGRAPLIEGLKAAVSMHLTKKGSQILWESFKSATPDVSLVFEMTFSGMRDPVEAKVTADWTKLRKQTKKDIGAEIGYGPISLGFDYSNFWDKARQSGALTIEYKGDPGMLQPLVERAYSRLQELLFEPVPMTQYQAGEGRREDNSTEQAVKIAKAMRAISSQQGGRAGTGASNDAKQSKPAKKSSKGQAGGLVKKPSGGTPWKLSLKGGYRVRNVERSGSYRLNFSQRMTEKLTTVMAGNIGSLHERYGSNTKVFRTINLSDDTYKRREIEVILDARNSEEFERYINFTTFSLSKKHGSGKETSAEIVINRRNFSSGKSFIVSYPWDQEPGYSDWKSYRYRVIWSFVGGSNYTEEWRVGDISAVTLTPPYEYRKVEFIADEETFKEKNVRLATIRVWHNFFGKKVRETINLMPGRSIYSVTREFAVPSGSERIEYEITWTLKDGSKLNSGKMSTDDAVIFCDEIPT